MTVDAFVERLAADVSRRGV
jgi:hypothetical protein